MAKYTVTHTCGHQHEYQLYGKHTERDRKIAWLEGQDCPACKRAAEEEAAKAATEGMELPELEGSVKQVAWANTIRAQFIEEARENKAITDVSKAIAVLTAETSAKEFIDWRNSSVVDFLMYLCEKQHKAKKAVEKALESVEVTAPTPAPKKAEWGKIAVNAQNVECTTASGAKINMPHSSDHDGYSVWVSLKLLRSGRHSYEYMLSAKSDMTFTLKKYGQGKWNKRDVIAEKTISAEEMAAAFGGWVEDAPRYSKPAVDPDKEEIVKHEPAPLAPVEIEADPELVR